MPGLFMKDGRRNFVMYNGQVYYVLNKEKLKDYSKEVYKALSGGDTKETEYAKYTRLIDVYGVTDKLKVFYCNTTDGTVYGSMDASEIDITKIKAANLNSDSALAGYISSELKSLRSRNRSRNWNDFSRCKYIKRFDY